MPWLSARARSVLGECGIVWRFVFCEKSGLVVARRDRHSLCKSLLNLRPGIEEGLNVQRVCLMLKNDYSRCTASLVVDDVLIVLGDDSDTVGLASSPPVVRVTVPEVSSHVETLSKSSHSIVDISIWRSIATRRDANEILDGLFGVVELGKDLRVGQRCQIRVRPSVSADFMASVVSSLSSFRIAHDIDSDIVKGGTLIRLCKGVVQRAMYA